MEAKLVLISPEEHAGEHNLTLPTLIGRGREATLKLLHPLVSRKHCEVRQSGDGLVVRDLGSLNGTFIRGERIETEAPLAPGDLLVVGNITFRAEYQSATGTTASSHGVAGVSDFDETIFLPEASESSPVESAPAVNDEQGPVDAELDWLDTSEFKAETDNIPIVARDAEQKSADMPRASAKLDVSVDDLPAIDFEEVPSPTSAAEFDPMDFLGSPDPVADDGLPTAQTTSQGQRPDFEPATSDLPDLEDVPLAPLDELQLETVGGEKEPWDFSDDDVSKPAARKSGGASAEDEDLDEFLKGLK